MRVVKEIAHPQCKITIFSWNNRYLIKLETGLLEQTFKINHFDVANEEEVSALIDSNFVQEAIDRFSSMGRSLHDALQRTGQ
jgi:hypothetical protein